jgi:hypothetical protein
VTSTLRSRRRPDLMLLTSTIEAAQLSDPGATDEEAGDRRPLELPLGALWLENQPREIVPEADLQRLLAEGRAQPAPLLERLREVAATDPYYAEILSRSRSSRRAGATSSATGTAARWPR